MRTIEADYANLNSTISSASLDFELALLASTDEMELLPESDKKTSVAEGVNIPEEVLEGTATREDVATCDTADVLQKSRLRLRKTTARVEDTN